MNGVHHVLSCFVRCLTFFGEGRGKVRYGKEQLAVVVLGYAMSFGRKNASVATGQYRSLCV